MRSRPRLPPFRAVIFDMDGLVLDSEPGYCEAWRMAAAECGVEVSEAFCASLFGRHADAVEAAMREALGGQFQRERFMAAAERHWRAALEHRGMPPMPGVMALLDRLRRRGVPYALATNSIRSYVGECLTRAGLEGAFPIIVARDQVREGKPAPDVFLAAARELAVPAAECLVLEDSEPGLVAARAAGAITVLVQRQAAIRAELAPGAHLAVASLAEVADWIVEADGDGDGK